jgi:Mn-dependent DtxR family transcriptional regulator
MGGRPPKQTDEEVLKLFIDDSAPFLFTSEVAELLDMTQQGAYNRLTSLEKQGYVSGKTAKNARGWWLTPEGATYVSEEF